MELLFKKLDEMAELPKRGKPGDAGLDLCSIEHVTLLPNELKAVRTGLAVELPDGHFGRVSGRSGMAFKNGILAFEGTIDENYRGEMNVLLMNCCGYAYDVLPGDKIAQLIVIPYSLLRPAFTDELSNTERGSDGFGSSGR